jgi:hypothetical protein
MENVTVVIAPTDWRLKPFDIKTINEPAWLPELYAKLKAELDRLR